MAKADRPSDERQEAPVDDLYPNPWNVNAMSPAEFESLKASIARYGLPFAIVVRPHPDMPSKWQIVDGEHRWRAAKALGWKNVWIHPEDYDDITAKEVGLVLNELHGQPDQTKLSGIVQELEKQSRDFDSFRAAIPFSNERLEELLGRIKVDYDALEKPSQTQETQQKPAGEKWVERIYRLPAEAAEVVDEAVTKVREEENFEHDWQALEVMAAETMAS